MSWNLGLVISEESSQQVLIFKTKSQEVKNLS